MSGLKDESLGGPRPLRARRAVVRAIGQLPRPRKFGVVLLHQKADDFLKGFMMSRNVMRGAVLLTAGAVLVDLGFWVDQPLLERVGNVAMILAGLGLAFLPAALGRTSRGGRICYWAGLALASLVDVPAVLDPSDLRAGRALGFPAMLLLSIGLVLMWRSARHRSLLVAASWFFVQLGPNVALFIIPNERPSFALQVAGVAVALAVAARRASGEQLPPTVQSQLDEAAVANR